MWRLWEGGAGVSPSPSDAYCILACAITRVYLLYVFCKFVCSLGVNFYESSFQKAILGVDFI